MDGQKDAGKTEQMRSTDDDFDGYAEQILDEVLSQNSGLSSSFRSSSSSQADLRMDEKRKGSEPPWILWSHSLDALLDDGSGFELFRKFLDDNGVADVLWFYLAVKGMRRQVEEWMNSNMEPRKRQILLKKLLLSIYTRFVQSIALQLLPYTRKSLDQYFSSSQSDVSDITVFDKAQQEAFDLMHDNLHQNFINSELYLNFVNEQAELADADSSSSPAESTEGLAEKPNEAPDSGVAVATPLTPSSHNVLPSLQSGLPSLAAHRSAFQPLQRPQPPPSLLNPWPKPANPIASNGPQPGPSFTNGRPPPVPTKPTINPSSFSTLAPISQQNPFTLTREAIMASTASRKAENEKKTEESGMASAYYSRYAPYQLVSARESEVMSSLTDNTRRRLNDPLHPEKNDITPWAESSRLAQKNREQYEEFQNIQPHTRHEANHNQLDPKAYDPRKQASKPEDFAKVLTEKLTSLTTHEQTASESRARMAQLLRNNTLLAQSSEDPVDDSEKALLDTVSRIKDDTPDSNNSVCVTPQPGLNDLGGQRLFSALPTKPSLGSSMSSNGHSFPVPQGPYRPPPVFNLSQPFRSGLSGNGNGPSLDNAASKAYQSHHFGGQQRQPPNSSSGYNTNQSSYFSSNEEPRMQHRSLQPQIPPQRHHEPSHQEHHEPQQRQRTISSSNSQRQPSRHSASSSRNIAASEQVRRSSKNHVNVAADRSTTVLYRRGQAGEFFMSKLIGDTTLKNFKKQILPENLKKENSLKFYFKREEQGIGVVWDEIDDDHTKLPLYDNRITATVET